MNILSREEIRRAAPAVFAEAPAPHLSDKYGFINTASVIDILNNEGYQVVTAKQDKGRMRDPMTIRHALTLRHESALQQEAVVGEYVPQILLINSHNGRTTMSMRAGLFRFVCSNGMIVGHTTMQDAIRHSKNLADQVLGRIQHIAAMSAPLAAKIDEWKKIELTPAQAETFAQTAAKLRFGEQRAAAYAPDALLQLRRAEDEGNSLWNVFNRVQENTTTHALEGRNANNRRIQSRPLVGITENTFFNERLWNLAEEFAH
jgi:hypothetical protein